MKRTLLYTQPLACPFSYHGGETTLSEREKPILNLSSCFKGERAYSLFQAAFISPRLILRKKTQRLKE